MDSQKSLKSAQKMQQTSETNSKLRLKGIYQEYGKKMQPLLELNGPLLSQYKGMSFSGIEIALSSSDESGKSVIVVHADPTQIEPSLKHVNYLHDLVQKASDEETIYTLCGQIFWWICHAKPWMYGDPSIAELFFRSLLSAKNLPQLPWKSTIIPWGETLLDQNPESFGSRFRTLFL